MGAGASAARKYKCLQDDAVAAATAPGRSAAFARALKGVRGPDHGGYRRQARALSGGGGTPGANTGPGALTPTATGGYRGGGGSLVASPGSTPLPQPPTQGALSDTSPPPPPPGQGTPPQPFRRRSWAKPPTAPLGSVAASPPGMPPPPLPERDGSDGVQRMLRLGDAADEVNWRASAVGRMAVEYWNLEARAGGTICGGPCSNAAPVAVFGAAAGRPETASTNITSATVSTATPAATASARSGESACS
eukprot:TRINITY_DN55528_c0_g1_i1.p1 TRINITY_DN55528_c0_g1~~TRINITY_DN55528_c0_g1_i1.p1  ORF type:complete len:249 (+),score=40.13 TRINITY_DN55528_c0_g1_i1:83-829(+)